MKVAIVGYPNVGKSSLVNRLAGGRRAVVHATAGVTRDRKQVQCEWRGRAFTLIDTGGVDLSESEPLARSIQEQAQAGIGEADVVLFLLDARAGIRPGDAELAAMLRAERRPVVLVANKCDTQAVLPLTAELHALGLGEPLAISAAHGLGCAELMDRLDALADAVQAEPGGELPEETSSERSGEQPAADGGEAQQAPAEQVPADQAAQPRAQTERSGPVRVALIGRPNVGKSSLLNRILGEERVIVSHLAGTTRDAIDTELEFSGRPVVLVDTAGLRRAAKVDDSLEYYSALRSQRAAAEADVAIVVCDAKQGITSQDIRVAELAMRSGCATLMLLNKWDARPDDPAYTLAQERQAVLAKLRQRPAVMTASARSGQGVKAALRAALALADRRAARLSTAELNRFLAEVLALRQPPSGSRRGRSGRLKPLYIAQIDERPPRFAIQVNARKHIKRDYTNFLENRLRARFKLDGVPLVIDFVERGQRTRLAAATPAGRRLSGKSANSPARGAPARSRNKSEPAKR